MSNDSTIGNISNWIDAKRKHKLLFSFDRSYQYSVAWRIVFSLRFSLLFVPILIHIFFFCRFVQWSIRIIPIYSWRKKKEEKKNIIFFLRIVSFCLLFVWYFFVDVFCLLQVYLFRLKCIWAGRSTIRSGVPQCMRWQKFRMNCYRKWENGIIRKRALG